MTAREHTAHEFTRLISQAEDGRAVFGCTFGNAWAGCAATEVRRPDQASPFAVARAKRRMAAREKRWKERTHA